MNRFHIKLIAMVAMIADHVGELFFPQYVLFRLFGRIAFPLFAWFIANGATHTSNVHLYLRNLFLFAVIAQVPYFFFSRSVGQEFASLNTIFTLFLGLLAVVAMRRLPHVLLRVSAVVLFAILALVFNADYGAWGVLSVVAFAFTLDNMKKSVLLQMLLFALFYVLPAVFPSIDMTLILMVIFQIPCLLALIVIKLYNNHVGPKLKYLFYWFYPVHLLVLYFIKIGLSL